MSLDARSVFDLYDSDGDGKVTPIEFQLIVRTLGYRPSNAEIDKLLNTSTHIKNHDAISFLEMQSLLPTLQKDSNEKELYDAFKVFDRDDNGLISIGELQQIFTTLGEPIDTSELNQIINQLKPDDTGKIPYADFIKLIASKWMEYLTEH